MQQTTKPVVATFKRKSKLRKVVNISILSLAGILLAVVIFTLLVKHFHKTISLASTDVCSTAPHSSLLKQDASAIIGNDSKEQLSLSNIVLSYQNYSADPNCLYVLLNYYISDSDASGAQTTLSSLEKVYNPDKGFSPLLAPSSSLNDLKADVVVLQKNSQSSNINLTGNTAQAKNK